VDGEALNARLIENNAPWAALDVWETEPELSLELASRLWQVTPHIAGYSQEGKAGGTEAIYKALCQFLGLPVRKQSGQYMTDPPLAKLAFSATAQARESAHTAIRATYDVRQDDMRFRRSLNLPEGERAAAFDQLRRDYPARREFSSVKIQLKGSAKERQQVFKALGFKLKV
jgi:erythronate-4-phosphate dehydrogenase